MGPTIGINNGKGSKRPGSFTIKISQEIFESQLNNEFFRNKNKKKLIDKYEWEIFLLG